MNGVAFELLADTLLRKGTEKLDLTRRDGAIHDLAGRRKTIARRCFVNPGVLQAIVGGKVSGQSRRERALHRWEPLRIRLGAWLTGVPVRPTPGFVTD